MAQEWNRNVIGAFAEAKVRHCQTHFNFLQNAIEASAFVAAKV
jgi:hypothetical protein